MKSSVNAKKSKLFYLLLIICIIAFVIGCVGLSYELLNANKEKAAFADLADLVENADSEKDETEGSEMLEVLPKYKDVYKLNHDMAGWIYISNTKINYPVMLTTSEPDYYLHRDFYGDYSKSGTPFIGGGCDAESDCFIIYGHNMKNDEMFGMLDCYEDKGFCDENSVICFDTIYEERQYKIFAVFKTQIGADSALGFDYYNYAGDMTQEDFDDFIECINSLKLYDTGIRAEYGEQIMLLSTCSYHTKNGRLVVAAKRIR